MNDEFYSGQLRFELSLFEEVDEAISSTPEAMLSAFLNQVANAFSDDDETIALFAGSRDVHGRTSLFLDVSSINRVWN